MQEVELLVGRDDQEPVWLGDSAGHLGEELRAVMGRPTRSRTWSRRRTAISLGEPATRRSPPTSRKASSIDRPSTSGVVSSKTSNTALLASE
jgi:hypothetical protein